MSASYKIIGDDGKEYGPLDAGQLRQWIAEGRVERRTPVFVDGAKDWNFVGLLPEFANYFSSFTPPPITPPGISVARQTNSFATAGLVFGILSVTFCCCCGGFPFNVLGLIFSIVALVQISDQPEVSTGRGMAIAGLILSGISILFMIIAFATRQPHLIVNAGQF